MSEIAGQPQTGLRAGATAVVHESYSFACMRCGHGWEQSYEIEHHVDADDHEFVLYVVDGQVVPSPLSRPTCTNCDNHVVRIMRPGRVASARDAAHRQHRMPPAGPVEAPVGEGEQHREQREQGEGRHWHLSDLLHPFQRRAS
ncbi:hypothetical protein [Streptomyces sp. V4I2]|uniref:hypothetical protein n=1 Tax=Streptomyces sp. V4I2 TaxID=3042280 RepID=UPI0027807471|nr:hypothetical protein [Streptomyces sp. V4I2]MDQ1046191.1 hypothetical protein [Streptomyces sp. V4I2]